MFIFNMEIIILLWCILIYLNFWNTSTCFLNYSKNIQYFFTVKLQTTFCYSRRFDVSMFCLSTFCMCTDSKDTCIAGIWIWTLSLIATKKRLQNLKQIFSTTIKRHTDCRHVKPASHIWLCNCRHFVIRRFINRSFLIRRFGETDTVHKRQL
jgi:hypothetical protein